MQTLQHPLRDHASTAVPEIVDAATWHARREELLVQEKAHTRATDALDATRRRLPMTPVEGDWVLRGPHGDATLLDLFEGRRQLVVYHHMLKPDDPHPCAGCSWWGDGVAHLEHLHCNDATLVLVAEAPFEQIEAYRERMGWTMPFYSQHGTTFGDDVNPSPYGKGSFAVSVFLRDGDRVFRTYSTWARGAEGLVFGAAIGAILPFGRQETWEDSPEGWPRARTYTRGGLHPDFTDEELSGALAPSSTGEVAARD